MGMPDLLPTWLGITGAALFVAVFASHLRHAVDSGGVRRWWHCGHLLMAASMVVMYLPASVLSVGIPSAVWQGIFGAVLVLLVLCGIVAFASRRGPSTLWLLMSLDMAAMVYMWAPDSYTAAVSWIAAAYLTLESLLWASDRIRLLDRPLTGGSYALAVGGVICVASAETLATEFDLRLSMFTMTVGMAYMIVAMQLMR